MPNKQVTEKTLWVVIRDCPAPDGKGSRQVFVDCVWETEKQALNYASSGIPNVHGYKLHVAKITATYEAVIYKSLRLTDYGETNGNVSTM